MPSKPGKYQPAGIGMVPSKTVLGRFIRERRLALKLSQALLAEKAGVKQSTIGMLEGGRQKTSSLDVLQRLAKVLGCDLKELNEQIPVEDLTQPKTDLGKLIRTRREKLGLTIEKFARGMNMATRQARNWEIRKFTRSVSGARAARLARVLQLEASDLSQFVGSESNPAVGKLGQYVRSRRKELLMNASDLARNLKVSREFVRQIEEGAGCSKETIKRLAVVLKVKPGELEGLIPKQEVHNISNKFRGTEIPTPLGRWLRSERAKAGLTLSALSERAHVSVATIVRAEYGGQVKDSTLDKIVAALESEIPPEELLDQVDD